MVRLELPEFGIRAKNLSQHKPSTESKSAERGERNGASSEEVMIGEGRRVQVRYPGFGAKKKGFWTFNVSYSYEKE